ncbi:MAG: carboxypeptidase-like regulatory domain-containing protein [Bacteroidales bacterium]|nr:carboxypeptidase-like regulatory domain-containing protein [Bacteroidales bacterium]
MKYLCLLLLSLSVSLLLPAQNKVTSYQVSGQIVEKTTGKGVPFATVMIKNDSLKIVKAMASDATGKFTVSLTAPLKYTLTASSVGFKEFKIPIVVSLPKTDLGKLIMEEGVMLKEVTVTAQKPLVRIDPDKITYSMEADPEAQANNALEMLRKVPLITVDAEENITLNGQSNFKVLVNGKSSSMMSANFKEALKSLPANTIKDIEVITNPSSKYDAEGVGGIINIITAKKTINGYNGSINSGVDVRGSVNLGAYLAVKIKKFSLSSRYYGSQFVQPESRTISNTEYFNNYRLSLFSFREHQQLQRVIQRLSG